MSEHDKLPFPFFPRPEAHRMIWAHLQPPVQKAIRGLLHRIEGATQKSVKIPRMTEDDSSEIAANCFLVYGDRGTGKTSVLLGAKYACEDERFFGSADDVRVRDDRVRDDAVHLAKELKDRAFWLDILDLEPLGRVRAPCG